nr:cationic amino acid transporter 1-like [Ipomoea batatas]GMD94905.1 cationic amino acid transporter 1-like [Ipomoea batatas]
MTAILIRKAASSPLLNYIASIIHDSTVNFIICTCIFIKSDPNYNPFEPINGARQAPPGDLVSILAHFIFVFAALALLVHFYHVLGVTIVDNRNKLIAFLLLILGASIVAASSNAWITYSITALAWFFSTLGLSYSVPRARNPKYWSVSMVPWVSSLKIALDLSPTWDLRILVLLKLEHSSFIPPNAPCKIFSIIHILTMMSSTTYQLPQHFFMALNMSLRCNSLQLMILEPFMLVLLPLTCCFSACAPEGSSDWSAAFLLSFPCSLSFSFGMQLVEINFIDLCKPSTRLVKINEIYFNKLHAKREAKTARKGKKKADQSDEPSGAQAEK